MAALVYEPYMEYARPGYDVSAEQANTVPLSFARDSLRIAQSLRQAAHTRVSSIINRLLFATEVALANHASERNAGILAASSVYEMTSHTPLYPAPVWGAYNITPAPDPQQLSPSWARAVDNASRMPDGMTGQEMLLYALYTHDLVDAPNVLD